MFFVILVSITNDNSHVLCFAVGQWLHGQIKFSNQLVLVENEDILNFFVFYSIQNKALEVCKQLEAKNQ